MLNLNHKGDGVSRLGLWEVVKLLGQNPHEWDFCPYKRGLRTDPFSLPHCGDTRSLQPGRGPSADHSDTLVLDFQPPEPSEVDFCLYATEFLVFCYSSLNLIGLRLFPNHMYLFV